MIDPPAPPSPAPPPAQPTDLTVELEPQIGDLILRWKAENPSGTSGTSYIIRRKLEGESSFSFIGVTGSKKFVDTTLIAGPDTVQYTVQGQRADQTGPMSQVFMVTFGRTPSGGTVAFVGASADASGITATRAVAARRASTAVGNGASTAGV
jgi:hypothetical protein